MSSGMEADEEWRPIPGFDGYEASSLGRVRSVDRMVKGGYGHPRLARGRVRAQFPAYKGYLVVGLHGDWGRKTLSVHRAVALAFHGVPPEGHVACHGDGNHTNNRSSNLRWATPSDNAQDQLRHGTNAHANLKCCSRGHAFEGPNLRIRAKALRNGRVSNCRDCIACHRARSYCALNGLLDQLQEVSDRYYAEIMRDHLEAA